MTALIDITGKRFGKLVVVSSRHRRVKRNTTVLVDCDCGRTGVEMFKQAILFQKQTHCGCENGLRNRTHGQSGTRLHRSWYNQKCANRICAKWRRFESMAAFFNWETSLKVVPRDYGRPLGPRNYLIVKGARYPSKNMILINGVPLTMVQCAEVLGVTRERARQLHKSGELEQRMMEQTEEV
jgi:hypothetical protein